jgi:uncharacterized alpha-E superfamily protein
MLSRVADSLYWMSRYLERAEHTARLVDVNLQLTLDQSPSSAGERWHRLQAGLIPAPIDSQGNDASGRARAVAFEMRLGPSFASYLAAARENARGIIACLAAARENARHVREAISSEMWEQINRLFLQVRQTSLGEDFDRRPHTFFRDVQEGGQLFQGITDSTICHDEGWHFIQVGRYAERALSLAAFLDVQSGALLARIDRPRRDDYLEWVGLLRSCTAFEPYCRANYADLVPKNVLAFLVLDQEFPHALRFSVDRVVESLQSIAAASGRLRGQAERLAGRLQASLEFVTIDELLASGINAFLSDAQLQCGRIQEAIHQTYVDSLLETVEID